MASCMRHAHSPSADAFGVARLEEGLRCAPQASSTRSSCSKACSMRASWKRRPRTIFRSSCIRSSRSRCSSSTRGRHRFAVWLKVDTGMNRLGFRPEELAAAHARVQRCAAVGTLAPDDASCGAEKPRGPETKLQLERFRALSEPLRLERSIANSAGLIALARCARRVGAARPDALRHFAVPERSASDLGLRPAMTFTTQLITVRHVAAGEAIGYNGIWRASRRSRIGIAAVGYGDGYPRNMRAGTPVLVNGREATDRRPCLDGHDDARRDGYAGRDGRRSKSRCGGRDCRRNASRRTPTRSPTSCSAGHQRRRVQRR